MRCNRIPRIPCFLPFLAAVIAICAASNTARGQQPYPMPGYPQPGYPQPYPQPQYPYPPQPVGPGAVQVAPTLPTYRMPLIIVAAPTEGTTLPEDKPLRCSDS